MSNHQRLYGAGLAFEILAILKEKDAAINTDLLVAELSHKCKVDDATARYQLYQRTMRSIRNLRDLQQIQVSIVHTSRHVNRYKICLTPS